MKKILIVEDDQIVANIYRNKFTVEGFQVEVALDGATGLELVREFHPDAVILDLVLPKMSGLELMKSIRAEPDCQQLPVIVFSNTYLSNMVQDAWKAGATKCLSKANCTPKQVIEVVRNVCGSGSPPPNGVVTAKTTTTASLPVASAPAPASGSVAAPATISTVRTNADAEFQAEIRKAFLDGLPVAVAGLRTALQALAKSDNEPAKVKQIQELYRRIRSLTANAGVASVTVIAQLSDAVEALVKDLLEKPKNINASTLRTIASAFDFLHTLSERGSSAKTPCTPPTVLVVDDEAISRRAVVYALEKAKLKSVEASDPSLVCQLVSQSNFDLIFLDVDMPGMTGFELCTKVRGLPGYEKTPIVFVTSLNDLESRASSTMSGGNDFIAKPFLFMELAVKALVHLLRARVEPPRAAA